MATSSATRSTTWPRGCSTTPPASRSPAAPSSSSSTRFLLGREREAALEAVADQLGSLRERLEGKGRAVPFGVEVMGRVRDLGTLDDVVWLAEHVDWVRPVLDFAHMHATSDGAYLEADLFAEALAKADAALEPGAPFHIHFSDIAFANRNETKHLPYGEGTLRAEPLAEALARFDRPGTVISESPGRGLEPGDQGDPRTRLVPSATSWVGSCIAAVRFSRGLRESFDTCDGLVRGSRPQGSRCTGPSGHSRPSAPSGSLPGSTVSSTTTHSSSSESLQRSPSRDTSAAGGCSCSR